MIYLEKLIFIFIAFICFISCSKDDGIHDLDKKEDPSEKYEEFCKKYTYGYHVKDTANLDLINKFEMDWGSIILTGTRNNKIWLGMFYEGIEPQVSEFIDTEELNRKQYFIENNNKYYFEVTKIIPNQVMDDNNVINISFADNKARCSSLIFSASGKIIKYNLYQNDMVTVCKWFDHSYIFIYNDDVLRTAIVDYDGTVIQNKPANGYTGFDKYIPVSHTDFIHSFYSSDERSLVIARLSIDNNSHKWIRALYIPANKNTMVTQKLIKKVGNIYTININTYEYGNEGYAFSVDINIETGSLHYPIY